MLKRIAKVLGFPSFFSLFYLFFFLSSFPLGTYATVADCMKTKMKRAEMSLFDSIVPSKWSRFPETARSHLAVLEQVWPLAFLANKMSFLVTLL